jgi:hypothetical protein
MDKSMNLIVLALLLLVLAICLLAAVLFDHVDARTNDQIYIQEIKMLTAGQEVTVIPNEVLETDEGEKVQIHIKIAKAPKLNGSIRLLSDLVNQEGVLQISLDDFKDDYTVSMKITGLVPPALVERQSASRVGERSFCLINLIYETNGQTQVIFTANSISTTTQLKESRLRINQIETILKTASQDERAVLAKSILKTAVIAREMGNPTIATSLCEHAMQTLNLKLTIIPFPEWYLILVIVLFVMLISLSFILYRQSKMKSSSGWIKAR